MSDSLSFIGKLVDLVIDRPMGSRHPQHEFEYLVNYGFVPGTLAPDGEPIDAYFLGLDKPIQTIQGRCIAVIQRHNDDDDKLVVVPDGVSLLNQEIRKATLFQEQYFESVILRSDQPTS